MLRAQRRRHQRLPWWGSQRRRWSIRQQIGHRSLSGMTHRIGMRSTPSAAAVTTAMFPRHALAANQHPRRRIIDPTHKPKSRRVPPSTTEPTIKRTRREIQVQMWSATRHAFPEDLAIEAESDVEEWLKEREKWSAELPSRRMRPGRDFIWRVRLRAGVGQPGGLARMESMTTTATISRPEAQRHGRLISLACAPPGVARRQS